MNKKIDLIIKNGKVFYKNKFQIINVLVNKGKILEISNNIKSYEAKKIKPGNSNLNIFSIIKNSQLSNDDEFKLAKKYFKRVHE